MANMRNFELEPFWNLSVEPMEFDFLTEDDSATHLAFLERETVNYIAVDGWINAAKEDAAEAEELKWILQRLR